MRGLALLLLLPGDVAAQSISFDITTTAQCVAADGGMDCVGRAAELCMEANEGGNSTNGMSICADHELNWWDERLNAIYGVLSLQLAELDADSVDYAPSQQDAMKEMQRAWIPFRDAKCEFAATEWTGGTGAVPATIWCLMHETGQQTLYLERRYHE